MVSMSAAEARRLCAKSGQVMPDAPNKAKKSPEQKEAEGKDYLRNLMIGTWKMLGYGEWPFTPEVAVRDGRRFRFDDYCLVQSKRPWHFDYPMVIEYDGRCHMRENRWRSDIEKFNFAAEGGIRVFHITKKMLKETPDAVCQMISEAIGR